MTKNNEIKYYKEQNGNEWSVQFEGLSNIRGNINKVTRYNRTEYQIIVYYNTLWLYEDVVDTFEEAEEFFEQYEVTLQNIGKDIENRIFMFEINLVEKYKSELSKRIKGNIEWKNYMNLILDKDEQLIDSYKKGKTPDSVLQNINRSRR